MSSECKWPRAKAICGSNESAPNSAGGTNKDTVYMPQPKRMDKSDLTDVDTRLLLREALTSIQVCEEFASTDIVQNEVQLGVGLKGVMQVHQKRRLHTSRCTNRSDAMRKSGKHTGNNKDQVARCCFTGTRRHCTDTCLVYCRQDVALGHGVLGCLAAPLTSPRSRHTHTYIHETKDWCKRGSLQRSPCDKTHRNACFLQHLHCKQAALLGCRHFAHQVYFAEC